ncbi:hypothetical protein MNBD_NITROSPINAE04-952 [hydrothermal vent metagenome]|uniref:General secretion pathway protein K n=1 Tax=hydrothermal vent metagenome TaxID=652676 RepID=A0A3B1BYV2_9ZZZZ
MNRRPLRNRSGMALLLTVLVMSLLTIIVVDFFHSAWIQSALAASYSNDTKALFAARSGQMVAAKILVEDKRKNIPADALTEEWAQGGIPLPIDDDYVFITIQDDSGKFDLNSLVSARGYPQERRIKIFRRMLARLEIEEDITDSIVDWLDSNGEPLRDGAEDGYYFSLKNPYRAKNGKLDSVDEILMIKGVTPKIVARLRPHITASATKKINVNTAALELLWSLDDDMTEDIANSVILARTEKPFEKREDIKRVPGMADIYPRIALDIDVKSDLYSVESSVTIGENTKIIRARYARNAVSVTTLFYKVY